MSIDVHRLVHRLRDMDLQPTDVERRRSDRSHASWGWGLVKRDMQHIIDHLGSAFPDVDGLRVVYAWDDYQEGSLRVVPDDVYYVLGECERGQLGVVFAARPRESLLENVRAFVEILESFQKAATRVPTSTMVVPAGWRKFGRARHKSPR